MVRLSTGRFSTCESRVSVSDGREEGKERERRGEEGRETYTLEMRLDLDDHEAEQGRLELQGADGLGKVCGGRQRGQ